MPDFGTLLSKPLDDVKKPAPLPAGTYHGRVLSYEPMESREKKTPYIRFHIAVSHAGDDIDPELITGVDLTKRQLRRDYFLTPDAEWRLKEFIQSCGVPTTGRSFNETLPELQNASVIISVTQRPGRDGDEFFNDIDNLKGEQ